MKHKVKIPIKEKTLFGEKVIRYETAYVDDKTYRKMQREKKPYTVDEMIFYDMLDDY